MNMCIYECVSIYICVCACVCMYIYIYILMYTSMYIKGSSNNHQPTPGLAATCSLGDHPTGHEDQLGLSLSFH